MQQIYQREKAKSVFFRSSRTFLSKELKLVTQNKQTLSVFLLVISLYQNPVVQMVNKAIHSINLFPVYNLTQSVFLKLIHWILIYPVFIAI